MKKSRDVTQPQVDEVPEDIGTPLPLRRPTELGATPVRISFRIRLPRNGNLRITAQTIACNESNAVRYFNHSRHAASFRSATRFLTQSAYKL